MNFFDFIGLLFKSDVDLFHAAEPVATEIPPAESPSNKQDNATNEWDMRARMILEEAAENEYNRGEVRVAAIHALANLMKSNS